MKLNMVTDMQLNKDSVIEKFLDMVSPLKGHICEMYLFGSRSRNDWRPDSDYDILIVLENKNREIISRFYDFVIDLLLDTGKLLSLKIFTASEFNRLKSIPTPFMHNVITEGIKLGARD